MLSKDMNKSHVCIFSHMLLQLFCLFQINWLERRTRPSKKEPFLAVVLNVRKSRLASES